VESTEHERPASLRRSFLFPHHFAIHNHPLRLNLPHEPFLIRLVHSAKTSLGIRQKYQYRDSIFTMILQTCRRRLLSSSVLWRRNSPVVAACPSFGTTQVPIPSALSLPQHWAASSKDSFWTPSFNRSFSTQESSENVPVETFTLCRRKGVRNVAIIAHVDHGE
jgi:hypothetical protein